MSCGNMVTVKKARDNSSRLYTRQLARSPAQLAFQSRQAVSICQPPRLGPGRKPAAQRAAQRAAQPRLRGAGACSSSSGQEQA